MTTTPEYDAILARKMAESAAKSTGCDTLYPAKGHTHTQLTEAETQSEILRIQDGAKSSFETKAGATISYSISSDGKSVDVVVPAHLVPGTVDNIPAEIQPKKRRGRPPGSKNKLK